MSAAKIIPFESANSGPILARPDTFCRHEVQFYFDDRFLIRSLGEYFETTLAAGNAVVVVATQSHRAALADELERRGTDLLSATSGGRYLSLDASETLAQFTIDGSLDEQQFRALLSKVISCSAEAARRTQGKVVIFGEMVALLWQRGEAQSSLDLEQFWNRLAEEHVFQLRCAYPIASFDRSIHTGLFSRICAEHHTVIPAEGYTDIANPEDPLRAIALLQQHEQALKTEAVERRMAQSETLEVKSVNQQLVKEIRKRQSIEEELRRFTRRLLTARDEEQRRIAAELHENTAQLLAALSLYFGVLHDEKASLNPRLASVVANSRSVSDSLLNEIRKLSHLLHPPTLEDMGLGGALTEYIEQFQASTGATVTLEISPALGRFNRNLEITVFRIVEEGLASLYPCQSRNSITVRLKRSENALVLEIQSDLPRAETADTSPRSDTSITGISERVMEHRGTVQFTSGPARSLITVSLPLETGVPEASSAAS